MSENLAIRPVTRLDYEQWLPLWRGYNAFYGRAGETALHPGVTQMTWSRFFDAYEPMHALVAESGDRLVGLTHYIFHRSTTSIQPIATCRISSPMRWSVAEASDGLSSTASTRPRNALGLPVSIG